jgi:hypothetical protein
MLGGVALVGQNAMLAGCAHRETAADLFVQSDLALLDEIADTLLPETATPGAKAAGVGPFMALMVADTYHAGDQKIFMKGLRTVDRECREMHGAPFMAATPAQRLALLERLDAEQFHHSQQRAEGEAAHYFRMMKELALLGYFTSEVGYTQAMRYRETPGQYDPCVPYKPGDRAWAPHA